MKELETLISQLRKLTEEDIVEDEFVDQFDVPEIEKETKVGSLTDELDAKVKVSRALDILKGSIEDFKETVTEFVDLIGDSLIMSSIEAMDEEVKNIENALGGNAESEPVEPIEPEETKENTDGESEEFPNEDIDFDAEASLDLLGDEEIEG